MADTAREDPLATIDQPCDQVTPQGGGAVPELQPALAAAGELSASELVSVLRFNQRERWRRGNRALVEEYLRQLPELRDNSEGILDLVLHEVHLREEDGERPQLDEYLERFPELAAQLRRQFVLHKALAMDRRAPWPLRSLPRPTTRKAPLVPPGPRSCGSRDWRRPPVG